jgi:hypothetical protein
MATETYKTLAAGQLANTSTDLYTVPGATKAISPCLLVFNTAATVETVKVHLYDGSTSRQHAQVDVQGLGYAEIFFRATLEATYKIKAQTTTATTVNYWLSGVELT